MEYIVYNFQCFHFTMLGLYHVITHRMDELLTVVLFAIAAV
jgi:hypothetical protein